MSNITNSLNLTLNNSGRGYNPYRAADGKFTTGPSKAFGKYYSAAYNTDSKIKERDATINLLTENGISKREAEALVVARDSGRAAGTDTTVGYSSVPSGSAVKEKTAGANRIDQDTDYLFGGNQGGMNLNGFYDAVTTQIAVRNVGDTIDKKNMPIRAKRIEQSYKAAKQNYNEVTAAIESYRKSQQYNAEGYANSAQARADAIMAAYSTMYYIVKE